MWVWSWTVHYMYNTVCSIWWLCLFCLSIILHTWYFCDSNHIFAKLTFCIYYMYSLLTLVTGKGLKDNFPDIITWIYCNWLHLNRVIFCLVFPTNRVWSLQSSRPCLWKSCCCLQQWTKCMYKIVYPAVIIATHWFALLQLIKASYITP